jgi:hypothetical protein
MIQVGETLQRKEKQAQGLKPTLSGYDGTTEVVPFPDNLA